MQSFSRTVTEGVNLNAPLTFLARSVQIDNITSSWIWVDGGGRFVPPFQYGVIIPLDGTAQGNIRWQTPVGVPVPTAGSASAQVTFMEADLPPTNGQSVTIPSQQILCPLSNLVLASATASVTNNTISTSGTGILSGGSLTITARVSAGINSLILTGSVFGSATAFPITVVGNQSGTTYYSGTLLFASSQNLPIEFIISPAADSTVNITFAPTGGNAQLTTVGVVGSYGTQAVAVEGILGNSVNVQLTGANGGSPISPQSTFQAIASLPVLSGPQAGAFSSAHINADVNSASTVTVVTGSVGLRITIMAIYANLSTTAVQAVDWKGSSSGVFMSFRCDTGNNLLPAVNFQPSGLSLAAGENLQYTGETANAVNMRGVVLYTFAK